MSFDIEDEIAAGKMREDSAQHGSQDSDSSSDDGDNENGEYHVVNQPLGANGSGNLTID